MWLQNHHRFRTLAFQNQQTTRKQKEILGVENIIHLLKNKVTLLRYFPIIVIILIVGNNDDNDCDDVCYHGDNCYCLKRCYIQM